MLKPITRPLNHRLWKLIYLLAIWIGVECAMTIKADSTYPQPKTHLQPLVFVEVHPHYLEEERLWLASQKLIDPIARPKNTATLVDDIGKYNGAAQRFNAEFNRYKTCWDIEPNKLLPFIQEMRDRLDKIQTTLTRLDEKEAP
jgi:hypothetical protein